MPSFDLDLGVPHPNGSSASHAEGVSSYSEIMTRLDDKAAATQMQQAAENVALVRALVVAVAAALFLFVIDQAGTRPDLAYGVLVGAAVYGGLMLCLIKTNRSSLGWYGHGTAMLDAGLIAAWLYATGGLGSPFYIFWYLAIISIAYQFNLEQIGAYGAGYLALHTVMAWASGELMVEFSTYAVEAAFLPIGALLAGMLADTQETVEQARWEALASLRTQQLAESEQARSELAHSEETWRSILENAPEVVMMIDPDGCIQYMNLATSQEELDALQGAPASEWLPAHAQERFQDALQDVIAHGETVTFEVESSRPSGDRAAYLTRMGPITEQGEVIGASLISTDISEQRAAERALETYTEELERSQQRLADYTRLAAHDLREPLRNIAQYAELLEQEHDNLPPDVEDETHHVIQAAKRLHRLVGGLRELTEVDRAPNREPLDLNDVLQDVIHKLTTDIDTKNATIHLHVDTGTEIHADPHLLRRGLTEILDNALRYADDEPEITIQTQREGDTIHLLCDDNGPGIPPDYRNRALEPFRRLVAWHEEPGIGAGLALAARVAERHGGTLSLDQAPTGGTRVTFTLFDPQYGHRADRVRSNHQSDSASNAQTNSKEAFRARAQREATRTDPP